jgi:hypothetical protein
MRGAFIGRDRSEEMTKAILEIHAGEKVLKEQFIHRRTCQMKLFG